MCIWRFGPSRAAKVSVQLIYKLTPIIMDGWFGERDQDRLPHIMAMSERYDARKIHAGSQSQTYEANYQRP